MNSCTLATLLKIENENYSGQFQDAMEKLKDKAEELEQAREENEKATGLEMDEFIDQRAKNRAERHRDNDRTPEELKKIEKLEQRRQEIEDHKKDLQTKYRTLKEDQNKKRIHLEELEQEDQNN